MAENVGRMPVPPLPTPVQQALSKTQNWFLTMQGYVNKGLDDVMHYTVVASVNDVVRRILNVILDRILSFCTVSVDVPSEDESYKFVMEWMAAQPFAKQVRELVSRTVHGKKPQILLLPGKGIHFFTFRGYPAWITRQATTIFNTTSQNRSDIVRITTFGRSTKRVKELLEEAMLYAKRNELGRTVIYVTSQHTQDPNRCWATFGDPRPRRQPSTLFLPAGQFEDIRDDCAKFLSNEEWYEKRGIPYRRGYLLYGTPGSGKSSLVEVLAGVLDLSICLLTLTQPGLTDQSITMLLNAAPSNAIILLEDIDATFKERTSQIRNNQLTFSGLINALDGVAAQGGRLLFMTTNHIEVLDEALLREGRMDRKILFDNAEPQQAQRFFANYYSLPFEDPLCVRFSESIPDRQISMAKIQGHFLINQTPDEAMKNINKLLEGGKKL